MMKKAISMLAAGMGLMAAPALAHPGHPEGEGVMATVIDGLIHPLTGVDHLLAMVAVGFWAAQYTGRKGLWLPAGFVSGMLGGAVLGFAGMVLPASEMVIAFSLCAIGAALLMRDRLPVAAAAGLCGVAGLFHGYAHAQEAGGSALPFVAGFATTTLLLHVFGGLAGLGLNRLRYAVPIVGGVVTTAGLILLAS